MLMLENAFVQKMKLTLTLVLFAMFAAVVQAQSDPAGPSNNQYSAVGRPSPSGAGPQGGPVSYASVTQLNGMLSQLEATAKGTLADLAKPRIDRWKTDANTKKQTLADVDSVQRNLQNALPEIIGQLRNSPEDLSVTFKLYRNLDALYDVLGSIVESVGAFGSKDDFQSLANDRSSFEGTRKQLAERIESLSTAKEAEVVRLRADLKTAQAAIAAEPPKKTVVDDTEPAKKPAPKKKPATTKTTKTPPPAQPTKPQ
jgi:hypothetical protein